MSDFYARGYEVSGPDGPWYIGVMKHPRRMNPALYVGHKSATKPVAYFRNDEDAARVELLLKTLAKGVLGDGS